MQSTDVLAAADHIIATGAVAVAAQGGPDAAQTLAYDLAHAASMVETARAGFAYGEAGHTEAALAAAFGGEMAADLIARVSGHESAWGLANDALEPLRAYVNHERTPEKIGRACWSGA